GTSRHRNTPHRAECKSVNRAMTPTVQTVVAAVSAYSPSMTGSAGTRTSLSGRFGGRDLLAREVRQARIARAAAGYWHLLLPVVPPPVRAFDVDVDALGLLFGQLSESAAQRLDVDARDPLVEMLGQPVHLVVVLVVLGPQLDRGDHLIGEAVAHHERRVPG